MAEGHRRTVAALLQHDVDAQVAAAVLRPQLPEARLVAAPAAFAEVVGGFEHQVAFGHVEQARGVAHRPREQAVARAGRGPGVAHADVAAEGKVGHAPGARLHGTHGEAAVVLVAEGDAAVVQEAFEVLLAVAPALAQQPRQLEAARQVELGAQVGLEQRDVRGAGTVARTLHEFVGPDELAAGELLDLAVLQRALAADAGDVDLGKAGQGEGAEIDRGGRACGRQADGRNERRARQDAHEVRPGGPLIAVRMVVHAESPVGCVEGLGLI